MPVLPETFQGEEVHEQTHEGEAPGQRGEAHAAIQVRRLRHQPVVVVVGGGGGGGASAAAAAADDDDDDDDDIVALPATTFAAAV